MEGEVRPTISEILSALSHALDITEGQPRGHAVRTCLIASRIGKRMGLDEEDLESLFYAALMKDAGSSAGSRHIHRLISDGSDARRRALFAEWYESKVGSLLQRFRGIAPPPPEFVDELTVTRCYRGEEIVRQLGFGSRTSEAILCLDEHWDGSGGPRHLQGEAIPLLSRILCLAQTMELFVTSYGLGEALEILESRSGRWFDPRVVRMAKTLRDEDRLWEAHDRLGQDGTLSLTPPKGAETATEADLDDVCEAFASIIDAKSSYTGQHSTRVMRVAVAAGVRLGIEDLATLRRSALLHDVGKLGVSSAILDKSGPLTDEEWRSVREHPKHSFEILGRIRGFRRIAEIAGTHHERLDGRGYWRGLGAEELDQEMRLLSTADVFDALTAERPYRGPLPLAEAYRIMKNDVGLDQGCVEAVWCAAAVDRSLCGAPA